MAAINGPRIMLMLTTSSLHNKTDQFHIENCAGRSRCDGSTCGGGGGGGGVIGGGGGVIGGGDGRLEMQRDWRAENATLDAME